MKFYDVDGDGSISYDEFLSGLREELTERRANMVKKAFSILDTNGSGTITINDI
jgi:Ca2+-binding EF-hand superfamily protein